MGGFGNEALSPTALAGPLGSPLSLQKGAQSAAMGLPLEASLRNKQLRQDLGQHLTTFQTMEAIQARREGRQPGVAATVAPMVGAAVASYFVPPMAPTFMKMGMAASAASRAPLPAHSAAQGLQLQLTHRAPAQSVNLLESAQATQRAKLSAIGIGSGGGSSVALQEGLTRKAAKNGYDIGA